MKPHELTATAFGPFGATVRIDFASLTSRSLFLIHGSTGAGKTSILDAMCFALYGVTSGGERSGREMRSHHASPRTKTEVIFTFDVKGRRYRIRRSPEQPRPRARGKGTTLGKSEVTLERRSREADEAAQTEMDLGQEQWTQLASKSTEVETRIQALLGLTADQFRQVVLLPQGRFREFLLAGSRERQAILESLFSTQHYRELEEAMREEASSLTEAISDEQRRSSVWLEQLGADSDRGALEVANPAATIGELQTKVDAADATVATTAASVTSARTALVEGRTLLRLEAELENAALALAKIESGAEAHQANMMQRDAAHRASKIIAPKTKADDLAEAARLQERRKHRADRALTVANEEHHAATAAAVGERARDEEREKRADECRELMALGKKISTYLEAKKKADRSLRVFAEAKGLQGRAAQHLAEVETRAATAADELDEARLMAGQVEQRRAAYVRLLQVRKTWHRHQEVLEETAAMTGQAAKVIDDLAAALSQLGAARQATDAAEGAWIRGQAADLAHQLVEGGPCPVCGSEEHPRPAAAGLRTDDASRMTLNLRRQELERKRSVLESLRTEQTRLKAVLEGLGKERMLLAEQLVEHVQRNRLELEAEVDRVATQVEAAEDAFDGLQGRKEALSEVGRSRERAAAELAEATAKCSEAAAQATQTTAVLEERGATLEPAMLQPGALEVALKAAEKGLAQLIDALQISEAALEAAGMKLAAAEEGSRQSGLAVDAAHVAAREAERLLAAALSEAGFDLDGFLKAQSCGAEFEKLEAQVLHYREQRAAALDRHRRSVQERKAAPACPSLEELETSCRHAETAHRIALAEQGALHARQSQLKSALEGLASAEKSASALRQRFAIVGRIAEVASGQNSHRMTFQRFVLATLLDEVLHTASDRLAAMSRGRYRLHRAIGPSSRKRAQGLELMVVDHDTGTERPAATLSGGESFLAALSLALGLADAVAARAGGRPLEAIFIDVGFGGLDPEALDLALAALSNLTDTGRVVGIISHVGELRERAPARLMVKPGKRGSRVSMHLS